MAAGSRLKVALLGVCSVALFAAVGCGSSSSQDAASDGSDPTTSVKTPTNAVDPARAEISTSWMLLYDEGGTDSAPPPEELYAVFAREQTDDEAKIAPQLVADSPCSMPIPARDKHMDLGKPIADKARILLRGVGSGDDNLVAVPTTADNVAIAVFPAGGGSCTPPSRNGLILAADSDGDTAHVYGMVDDHVRSVDVITGGETHPAKLGENGFSVALPGGAEQHLDRLVLHKADGSKTEVPLG
jgi:hypothetical protein